MKEGREQLEERLGVIHVLSGLLCNEFLLRQPQKLAELINLLSSGPLERRAVAELDQDTVDFFRQVTDNSRSQQ